MINRQKFVEIFESDAAVSLDSDLEIEDVIVLIGELNNKIDFLKKLKAKRTKDIDVELQKIEEKVDKYKKVITETLAKFNHKSLNFPGVGKVSTKALKGKWEIIDEPSLINYLEQLFADKDLSAVIVNEKSLVKKELNKVLSNLEEIGKVPSFVKKTPDSVSLSVSIEDSSVINDRAEDIISKINNSISSEKTEISEKTFDQVDF